MTDGTTPSAAGPLVRLRRSLKAAVYTGPARDRWQHPHRVVETLDVRPGMRIADIGAGGGYFTFRLARRVGPEGRVYAVDTDADLRSLVADRAAQRGLPNVVPIAAEESDPRLPEPVDLALVVDTLHHLPDPPHYLRGLASHLVPGGRIAVIEPEPRWWLFGHATEPAALPAALEAAGLTVDAHHEFLAGQAFVVGRLAG